MDVISYYTFIGPIYFQREYIPTSSDRVILLTILISSYPFTLWSVQITSLVSFEKTALLFLSLLSISGRTDEAISGVLKRREINLASNLESNKHRKFISNSTL